MANIIRNIKVPPNSVNLAEAHHRTLDFFRTACRSIPTIIEIYNIHDVVKPAELRSSIAAAIRKNSKVNDPKVIDMLLFKGLEELSNFVEQSKQRHHILGQYVLGRQGLTQDPKDEGISEFLKNFYTTNYN